MTEGLMRFAKSSQDYANEIAAAYKRMGGRKLTASEKSSALKKMYANGAGVLKIGKSMIGPIQLKLRYQGIVRNVLLEDALEPGVPVQYDVLDQWGQAYILHSTDGEVKVKMFEAKRVQVDLFRIAAFPKVRKEDVWMARANVVEYAQEESKEAIMKLEDSRLVTLLEGAISQFQANNPDARTGGALPNEITIASDYITANDLYSAVSIPDTRQLDSSRILCNTRDYRDFYRWEINQTGWAFKDNVVAGETITTFGEFQIGKSPIIPAGTMYLTPAPEFLGVMPVMYSLDVEENNKAEDFHYGWVMDELIGMAILNAAGIVALRKS